MSSSNSDTGFLFCRPVLSHSAGAFAWGGIEDPFLDLNELRLVQESMGWE